MECGHDAPATGSVAAARRDDDANRAGDDHQVAPEAPTLDVLTVERNASGVIHVIAPAHLPGTGKTGPGAQIVLDAVAVFRDLRRNDRPWADKAHVAAEDVDELRQLVDAGLAHRRAKRRDARVLLQLVQFRPFPRGVVVL